MTPSSPLSRFLWGVFFLSLISRLTFLLLTGPVLLDDSFHYVGVAENLIQHGTLLEWDDFEGRLRPQTLRTPGYSAYCAIFYKILGIGERAHYAIAASQVLMVSIITVLAVGFARRFSRQAAILTGLFCALDPWLSYAALTLLTETLFTLLLVLTFLSAARAIESPNVWISVIWGTLIGLCTLVRPGIQHTIMLVPLVFWCTPLPRRKRAALGAIAVVAFSIPTMAWRVRNYALTGHSDLATHQGRSLLWETAHLVRESAPADYERDAQLARARDIVASTPKNIAQFLKEHPEQVRPPHGGQIAFIKLRREMGLSEQEADALMGRIAVETILINPLAYAGRAFENTILFLTRIGQPVDLIWDLGLVEMGVEESLERGRYFYPLVNLAFRVTTALVFGPLLVIGLTLSWRRYAGQRLLVAYLLGILAYHLLIVTLVAGYDRYRLPLHPVMYVFVSLSLLSLWAMASGRFRSQGAESLR